MEFKWSITSLHAKNDQSLGDVVVQVRWKVIGTDSNGISGYFDGATPLKVENINHSEFINFDQLTEDTVIEWVKLSISDLLYTESSSQHSNCSRTCFTVRGTSWRPMSWSSAISFR